MSTNSASGSTKLSNRQVLTNTGLAILASVAANLVTLFALDLFIDFPAGFLPLTPLPIILFTSLFIAIGGGVLWLMNRWIANPLPAFRVVAIVALLLSIIPNIASMINPASFPMPGATSEGFGILIVFHFVAGIVATILLSRK